MFSAPPIHWVSKLAPSHSGTRRSASGTRPSPNRPVTRDRGGVPTRRTGRKSRRKPPLCACFPAPRNDGTGALLANVKTGERNARSRPSRCRRISSPPVAASRRCGEPRSPSLIRAKAAALILCADQASTGQPTPSNWHCSSVITATGSRSRSRLRRSRRPASSCPNGAISARAPGAPCGGRPARLPSPTRGSTRSPGQKPSCSFRSRRG